MRPARAVLGPRLATLAIAAGVWWWPVPAGLTGPAWHLFAIFAAAIFAVIAGALPLLTASILALALSVLTGTLAPEQAYSGFANGTILLIVVAFGIASIALHILNRRKSFTELLWKLTSPP